MSNNILTVENLTLELAGEEIIKDLSFSVKERESLVILGPNGAGKTTLLRALLGAIPYQGKINWGTKDISYLPPQELVQRKGNLPMTIKDFFGFKKASSEEIATILNSVGLEKEVLNKRFGTLSTGQFQRLIIAWALVDNPKVLLFDEPTAGIDIGGQETIYTLLHKFWEERNLTILLVTHDLNVVWEHANKVLCLNKRGLCFGSPKVALTPEKLRELYGVGVKFHKHTHDTY
ncbi:metal ABC transporter ATP-binding protein [Candidatus Woesebacteria bacterium]|nr:metal ABC transporter ATP-binding protein [Candidatus Woesebacteria bacterium]